MVTSAPPDPPSTDRPPSPLAGVRVLDFTRVVAGPFATRMMADLGADVVKVEPPDGDITRIWGEERGGQSGFYVQQNAGKRNVCVDLRADGAGELLLSIADTNAALHGLVAVLAALHLRTHTGTGQHIDLAMLNAMTVTDDYAHTALDAAPPFRLGGEVWPTGVGYLLIAANSRVLWHLLKQGDRVDDGLDPDASVEQKSSARHQVMADWFAGFTDRASLIAELDELNIAWGDVTAPNEVFDTDIAVERRLSTVVDDRAGGVRRITQSPYHFSNATSAVAGPAPHRGEHHREVFAEWIGLDDAAVEALESSGTLLIDESTAAQRKTTT